MLTVRKFAVVNEICSLSLILQKYLHIDCGHTKMYLKFWFLAFLIHQFASNLWSLNSLLTSFSSNIIYSAYKILYRDKLLIINVAKFADIPTSVQCNQKVPIYLLLVYFVWIGLGKLMQFLSPITFSALFVTADKSWKSGSNMVDLKN